jgi:hypothetical protein
MYTPATAAWAEEALWAVNPPTIPARTSPDPAVAIPEFPVELTNA